VREAQRLGFQPGKRTSMVSSSSSQSLSSAAAVGEGSSKRPAQNARWSSSSLQTDEHLHLHLAPRSGSRSRPASYTSSGEDSPNPFNDRASSSASLPGLAHSSRSVSSSGESLPRVRQRSRERSTTPSRARKSSTPSSRPTLQQEPVPPVPFLARPWNMSDLAIPPANLMHQGPFLASLRTQGTFLPSPAYPNFYMNGQPNGMMPMPMPMPMPMGYGIPRQSTDPYPHANIYSRDEPSGPSKTNRGTRRVSSYGPTRSQSARP